MQFMKLGSLPANPEWTGDIAEAMYFDDHTYAFMWWEFLNNCQILELIAGNWTDATRK
jgi:hypothetical protein